MSTVWHERRSERAHCICAATACQRARTNEGMAAGGRVHQAQHEAARAVSDGFHSQRTLPGRDRAHRKQVAAAPGSSSS